MELTTQTRKQHNENHQITIDSLYEQSLEYLKCKKKKKKYIHPIGPWDE